MLFYRENHLNTTKNPIKLINLVIIRIQKSTHTPHGCAHVRAHIHTQGWGREKGDSSPSPH